MAQWVYSIGCVTAVGLDAAQTCAAIRARQSGILATVPVAGDPLMAAPIAASARLKRSRSGWHLQVGLRALRECLRFYSGSPSRLALFIALPEPFRGHPITRDGTGYAFVSGLVRALGVRLSPHSRVMLEGHASAAAALDAAEGLLERNAIDAAVIGGIDSLINDEDQQRLRDSGRRHEPSNPFGVIPGEAAAFFMTGRDAGPFSQPAIAGVLGAAAAYEAQHLLTDRYSVGEGLQQAIRGALQRAGMSESRIEWRVTDINGERYRAWESTALLARQYRAWRDGLPCLHVPAYTGDVGCASMPLQLGVGAHAMQVGHAPGPVAVCESTSEGPLRGACIVVPAAGAREPPFRMLAAGAAGAAGPAAGSAAMVGRLALRLPHELGWLAQHRRLLVGSNLDLRGLLAHDERIDAHLALLRAMGAGAWQACFAAIEDVGAGALFAPAVVAIEDGDRRRVEELIAADESPAGSDPDLADAFGFASSQSLRGLVAAMAKASSARARELAVAAMHQHRAEPGSLLGPLLDDPVPAVRARALQLAGEVGVKAYVDQVLEHLVDEDAQVRFRAAWAATLLGRGDAAWMQLSESALGPGPHATDAAQLLLRAASPPQARRLVEQLAWAAGRDKALTRRLLDACAAAGDPMAVPWLIKQMAEPRWARAAGEAFSMICGADLRSAGLVAEAAGREHAAEPEDDQLVDPDLGLPVPDADKVAAWWREEAHRFRVGERYFLGCAPDVPTCTRVLREGGQRRRVAAAIQLCVLQPGSRLFPTSSPAWRQQGWLAAARS